MHGCSGQQKNIQLMLGKSRRGARKRGIKSKTQRAPDIIPARRSGEYQARHAPCQRNGPGQSKNQRAKPAMFSIARRWRIRINPVHVLIHKDRLDAMPTANDNFGQARWRHHAHGKHRTDKHDRRRHPAKDGAPVMPAKQGINRQRPAFDEMRYRPVPPGMISPSAVLYTHFKNALPPVFWVMTRKPSTTTLSNQADNFIAR